MATVRMEGLATMKHFNDLIENRTCDLPAYSILSQPQLYPRYRVDIMCVFNFSTELRFETFFTRTILELCEVSVAVFRF
jgi:hypothetical protein